MKPTKWKLLHSEYLFNNDNLVVRKDQCELPGGKLSSPCYVLEYPDWVNAVAITEDNKVILIKQYRHASGNITTELPGGWINPDDTSPEDAIRRELEEEVGYICKDLISLGSISPNPSTSNNKLHMFLATGGSICTIGKPDEDEQIETILLTIDDILPLLLDNKLLNNVHFTCFFYALLKLGYIKA